MKPKILVDLSKVKNLFNGLGQYSLSLGNALLDGEDQSLDLTLLIPKNRVSLFPNCRSFHWKNNFYRDTTPQWMKAVVAPKWPYDWWHVTAQDSGFWPVNKDTPVIFTIHDLNFLRECDDEIHIAKKIAHLQDRIDQSKIVTVISEFVADEVRSVMNLEDKPLEVIHNGGCLTNVDVDCSLRKQYKPGPFLFSIGECLQKKNFHVLLPLLEKLPQYNLFIAGKNTTEYADKVRADIDRLGLSERVHLIGVISQEEKYMLYENCEAFLFPSLTEGFGLPVIEAMSFGKPVFLSNSSSLPEIGGSEAFYWDSYEVDHMLSVFNHGMKAKNDGEFAAKVKSWANHFTWEASASKYLNLYSRLLD